MKLPFYRAKIQIKVEEKLNLILLLTQVLAHVFGIFVN